MATATTIKLNIDQKPQYRVPGITQASSDRTNTLLQENHENHHIFFNSDGFHNHIAHHLLTIWSLAATPAQLQEQYERNASYQRSMREPKSGVVEQLKDPCSWSKFLGKEQYYHDFLQFFQSEIENSGWQNVLQRFLFARDERAEDMLCRLFGGFLHPLIHLGFGVEFQQPAIIAEALAQTAIHANWMSELFIPAETKASSTNNSSKPGIELLEAIRGNETIRTAPQWSDGNKLRDGLLRRSPANTQLIDLVAQYRLPSSPSDQDLRRANAEMTALAAYFTGAAQRAGKMPKIDFYYMHCLNSSIFFPAFLEQEWLSKENKARLLEWKVRADLALYASRASPELDLERVRGYAPKLESGWEGVRERVKGYADDGHAAKVVRALEHGERVCEPFEGMQGFSKLERGDWLKMGHMAIDSVEADGPTWVRSAGFDEAWKDIPDATAKL